MLHALIMLLLLLMLILVLPRIDFIALTERLDESLVVVQAATGLPTITRTQPFATSHNVFNALSPRLQHKETACLKDLAELSALDDALYTLGQVRGFYLLPV